MLRPFQSTMKPVLTLVTRPQIPKREKGCYSSGGIPNEGSVIRASCSVIANGDGLSSLAVVPVPTPELLLNAQLTRR